METERCPDCQLPIKVEETPDGHKVLGLDGEAHHCYANKPIGRALEGRLIETVKLRNRRLEITLDGGLTLFVRGAEMGTRRSPVLKLQLFGLPGGVIEE